MVQRLHLVSALSACLIVAGMITAAKAEEALPVFELDCVSFAGRFLDKAPTKKKAYPGLAVDGTEVAISPDTKKVLIKRLFPGEAAEKAGVEVGDEVVSVNGYQAEGLSLRELFTAYHMYEPTNLMETLIVQKKDGSQKTLQLQLITLDTAPAEEKAAWVQMYKGWGY